MIEGKSTEHIHQAIKNYRYSHTSIAAFGVYTVVGITNYLLLTWGYSVLQSVRYSITVGQDFTVSYGVRLFTLPTPPYPKEE